MLALHIIMGAGYGVSLPWESDQTTPQEPWPNHTLSFKDAVLGLIHHLLPIVLIPKIFRRLPIGRIQRMNRDYEEFGDYLRDLLNNHRTSEDTDGDKVLGDNLISALAKSAEMEKIEDKGVRLTDEQVLGNAFMFLVAGHETTAHTMWYALIMLSLHPQVQSRLLSEIQQIILPKTRLPTYEDFANFTYALCIVNETLRLFPPVVGTPKVASEDCVLSGRFPIPRGTAVIFDILNVHRDKEVWGEDAGEFNPSRFDNRVKSTGNTVSATPAAERIRVPAKGAFLPFAEGQRSCLGTHPPQVLPTFRCGFGYYGTDVIGKKFAQVELVGILVMIVREWKIELQEGWTEERVWEVVNEWDGYYVGSKGGCSLGFQAQKSDLVGGEVSVGLWQDIMVVISCRPPSSVDLMCLSEPSHPYL